MKLTVFVVLISALFVDCRHVHHKTHKKHLKESKAAKKEEIIPPVKAQPPEETGQTRPMGQAGQMGQMQQGAANNPYSCCQSANPPSCCNGHQMPGMAQPGMPPMNQPMYMPQQPMYMPQPPMYMPQQPMYMNQHPMYMNQAVPPVQAGGYQPPQAGCCQSPYPMQHPVNTASNTIMLQGCCSTAQPTDQSSPQNNAGCCQHPNAPPCCLHVKMKAGEQKNITVNNNGHNYVLNVKLISNQNSGPPTPPMNPTSKSSPGPSSGSTPSHPPTSAPSGAASSTSGASSSPTKASSSAPSSSGPTPGGPTTGQTAAPANSNECQQKGLAQHNAKRAIHNSPAMTLDATLNQAAQAHANKLAGLKAMQHAANLRQLGQGENLAYKCSIPDKGYDCGEAVDNWYNEISDYDFGSPGFKGETGHFTQVVWKASTKLGIAKASYQKNGMTCWMVVARYKEAGNMAGKFPENVQRGSFTG